MLQIIISPAKQMRMRTDTFEPRGIPPFPAKTQQLFDALCMLERKQGAKSLKALWRVNDKLLSENIGRMHEFEPVMDETALDDPALARLVGPAVFSYVGIQYRSMAPDVLDLSALDWLEQHLWVLSGFYGCVRPFDAVQPYRLEMGAKLAVGDARNLYEFWDTDIARAIEGGAAGKAVDVGASDEPAYIVNLASAEYAKAVLPHLDPETPVVTCIFGEELRNGKPVQRATASKIARGSMVRWMAERGVENASELVRFNVGYEFVPELSGEDVGGKRNTLVFMRNAE